MGCTGASAGPEALSVRGRYVRAARRTVVAARGGRQAAGRRAPVAAAVDAQDVEGEETLGYVGAGTGLVWRVGGQTVTAIDGNATSAPWVGGVPSFDNSVVLLPGEEPTRGIEQFDIPEPGGHLTYLNPDGSMVRWEAPPRTPVAGWTTSPLSSVSSHS